MLTFFRSKFFTTEKLMSVINSVTRSPSIEKLIEMEVERRLKERQSEAQKAIEELRPLCEELPQSVIDPISLEVFDKPMVTRCGHTFERDSLISIVNSNPVINGVINGNINCPICKTESGAQYIYYDQAFKETIDQFKKIEEVFNKYVNKKHIHRIRGDSF